MLKDKNGKELKVGEWVSLPAEVTGFMEPDDGSVYLRSEKGRRINVMADDVISITVDAKGTPIVPETKAVPATPEAVKKPAEPKK